MQSVWDPYFGEGSTQVLKGSVRSLPFPDALVGAFFYLLDAILGCIGGRERWRTQPWAILIQTVITVCLGIAGVILTILQRLVFGSYCTLCLASAACSVLMVGFVLAEALAALQHLKRVREQGGDLKEAFWGARGWRRMASGALAR